MVYAAVNGNYFGNSCDLFLQQQITRCYVLSLYRQTLQFDSAFCRSNHVYCHSNVSVLVFMSNVSVLVGMSNVSVLVRYRFQW